MATATFKNISASTKHCVEISNALRFKSTNFAKKYLEGVIQQERAVPFRRFYHNVGHKVGMSAGRFPVKAAAQFLMLLKSVEANAHVKGLNTTHLKIVKLIANKASTPFTGGRMRTKTKRTHLDIAVAEITESKRTAKKEDKKEQRQKKSIVEKKVNQP